MCKYVCLLIYASYMYRYPRKQKECTPETGVTGNCKPHDLTSGVGCGCPVRTVSVANFCLSSPSHVFFNIEGSLEEMGAKFEDSKSKKNNYINSSSPLISPLLRTVEYCRSQTKTDPLVYESESTALETRLQAAHP